MTNLIVVSALLHMGVALALLPTTGVILPFMSYGRSGLLVCFAAVGVLLSVARAARAGGGRGERDRPRVLFAGGGTGGHLYPALALAEALPARWIPGAEVLFVGARRGVEARVLPERGVPHRLLPFEPIRRSRPWENWRLAARASARSAARALRAPSATSGPTWWSGRADTPAARWSAGRCCRGIPTALQEQNSYPGAHHAPARPRGSARSTSPSPRRGAT